MRNRCGWRRARGAATAGWPASGVEEGEQADRAEAGEGSPRTEQARPRERARSDRQRERLDRDKARLEREMDFARRDEAAKRRDEAFASTGLAVAFASIAEHLFAAETFDEVLQRIAETAAAAVAGCDNASVTLRELGGYRTGSMTNAAAGAVDQAQYDAGEGP